MIELTTHFNYRYHGISSENKESPTSIYREAKFTEIYN